MLELEAGLKGEHFMALAPKCYCLVYDHPNSKGEMYVVESKGVTMTHENHALINPHTYETMLMQAAVAYEGNRCMRPRMELAGHTSGQTSLPQTRVLPAGMG
jgi:hypothetical protein